MTDPDPSGIMEIATGYWRSKVLLSAVGLGHAAAVDQVVVAVGRQNRASQRMLSR